MIKLVTFSLQLGLIWCSGPVCGYCGAGHSEGRRSRHREEHRGGRPRLQQLQGHRPGGHGPLRANSTGKNLEFPPPPKPLLLKPP